MPRASKKQLNKNIILELQDNFAFLISSLTSSLDIQRFFETFLTHEEKLMLTKRLMLHLMLENSYDPVEITDVLGLSRDTVYKHKFISNAGDITYKKIIGKIAKREKVKVFWKRIDALLRPVDLLMESRSNKRARAKLLSGDF